MSTTAAILLGNLTGLTAGVVITLLLVRSRISNTTIKGKLKQKKTHGSTQDVKNSITKTETRRNRKEERQAKRASRKSN